MTSLWCRICKSPIRFRIFRGRWCNVHTNSCSVFVIFKITLENYFIGVCFVDILLDSRFGAVAAHSAGGLQSRRHLSIQLLNLLLGTGVVPSSNVTSRELVALQLIRQGVSRRLEFGRGGHSLDSQHLEDVAQVASGLVTTMTTVGDNTGRLATPFVTEAVESVLQSSGNTAVVLGSDEDEAAVLLDEGGPVAGVFVLVVRRGVFLGTGEGALGLVEDGEFLVGEIDDVDGSARERLEEGGDVVGHEDADAGLAGAADDEGDFGSHVGRVICRRWS